MSRNKAIWPLGSTTHLSHLPTRGLGLVLKDQGLSPFIVAASAVLLWRCGWSPDDIGRW